MNAVESAAIPDLIITEGGPAHALLQRLKVARPEPRSDLARTALVLAAVTWVPLCMLSLLEGLAFGRITIPFFKDLAVHVRFLLAAPILIFAEAPVGGRIREVARHFYAAGLVSEADAPRYAEIVAGARKLRDSHIAELVLLGVAYWST